jgi:hypothetical protein
MMTVSLGISFNKLMLNDCFGPEVSFTTVCNLAEGSDYERLFYRNTFFEVPMAFFGNPFVDYETSRVSDQKSIK